MVGSLVCSWAPHPTSSRRTLQFVVSAGAFPGLGPGAVVEIGPEGPGAGATGVEQIPEAWRL